MYHRSSVKNGSSSYLFIARRNLRSALLTFTIVVVTIREHRRAAYAAPRLQYIHIYIYTRTYGVTHGGGVRTPRVFLALDPHLACYATPYIFIYGVTHGGWCAGTEGPCGTRPARRPLRDPIHRAPQGYTAPRPNTYT